MKKQKTFEILTTEDGSQSFYSHLYGEGGHSTSGAKNETITHYIEGCNVAKKYDQQDCLSIFEVGFGIGLGFRITLETLGELKTPLYYYAIEIDHHLIEHAIKENPLLTHLQKTSFGYELIQDNLELVILMGNARQTIPSFCLQHKFDVIFQDAFSPKRNAELWTTEWFSELNKKSKESCLMSTYSSSSAVRKSMIAAGWKVHKGTPFGPKRSSTRASLTGKTDDEIIKQLERSAAPELKDDMIEKYQEEFHAKK
jgi:tRNA U34 5-methylaminomethyl-2-thiouridine-forming methyltransferase MnmC